MHFLRAGVDKRFDAYKTPHPAATGQVDVVGGFKVIAAVILAQFRAETDRRYAVAGVVLAPLLINVVELLGADGVVRLKAEVTLGLHEVDDIVAAALDGVHVGGGSFADREAEIVLHQPVQSFQTPQQDAFQLGAHLLHKEGIIRAVGRLVFGGQDELTAEEAILIVEFALDRRKMGMSITWAAVLGAGARLRPILMTSLAMVVGLLPLMFAFGVGAHGNRTLGTASIGGMLIGMICQIFIVPALFVIFQYLQEKVKPMEWEDIDNADAVTEIEQYAK